MSESKTTTNHEEIKRWAEERNGAPASVEGTGDGDPGVLRICFEGEGTSEKLEQIGWDDFFDKFEEENLAFLYQDTTGDGGTSRFHKFVERGN